MSKLEKGDYVLATKYSDGDPGDQWAVGFYDRPLQVGHETRHLVVDNDGNQFRRNGFRRVEKISPARGEFIVSHEEEIEASWPSYRPRKKGCRSLWGWKRAKMKKPESRRTPASGCN